MISRRVLLVFAKAPIPGLVKTRLATDVGALDATKIYRRLGRQVTEQLRGGAYRTVIYYDPPDSEHVIRAWLGDNAEEYLPQKPGDLGDKLAHAFEWGFGEGDLVCVVGTDIPELDRSRVEEAFSLLSEPGGPDAVFGPALDGGYYLLGLRQPAPGLLAGIPWSTDRVLLESVRRAHQLGLTVRSLSALADVDRAEDLPDRFRSHQTPESDPAEGWPTEHGG